MALALCTLLGCIHGALAEDYVTLPELREQAAGGWHETYTDKYGRETTVDIDVQVFGEDVAPVVKVKPAEVMINMELAEEGAVLTDRTLYRNNPADDIFGARSGQVTMAVHHTYGDKIDMNNIYGADFGAPLTMQELKDRAGEVLAPHGIALDDFLFEQPKEFSVRCKMKRQTQEVIAPAAYLAHFWQTMYGMPIFEHINRTFIKQNWPEYAPQSVVVMRNSDEYSVMVDRVEELEVLAQDIPLCSFDVIKKNIEEKIHSGNVQKVYSVRFGYVVYNDDHYPKDMPTIYDAHCYYLVPTWLVECIYMDKPSKTWAYSGKSSDEWMDNEKNTTAYYRLMVNAQTGEVFDRNDTSLNGRGDCNYKGFISWDDVN